MEENELIFDFENKSIKRGMEQIITFEELLFLMGCAKEFENMGMYPPASEFMAELREVLGFGFTREQFEQIKKMNEEWRS